MADKLTCYNKILVHLEERRLTSLSEQREPRRVLDSIWDELVAYCLAQGLWRFAKRVVSIDASTTVVPAFGYLNAFKIPDDWVRTVLVSTAPQLDPPLLQYAEEAGFLYANMTPVYLSYVSNDPLYGFNLGAWPANFTEYVEYRGAAQACGRLPGKADLRESLEKREDKARRNAKGSDAMNDPPGLPPVPFLVRARRGAFGPGGLFIGGGTGEN